jgi:hypothetical protein
MPGSDAEWPASATMRRSASGKARWSGVLGVGVRPEELRGFVEVAALNQYFGEPVGDDFDNPIVSVRAGPELVEVTTLGS